MTDDTPYSRSLGTAARLGELAPDRHRFTDKRVLLTGEPGILSTENGRECFLDSLRLLIRICPNVSVSSPGGFTDFLSEVCAIAQSIQFGAPIEFISGESSYHRYDAILCVGETAHPELPWTVINSDGWLARVSS